MQPFINNYDDIMELLVSQAESVSWDEFYELRNQPANFRYKILCHYNWCQHGILETGIQHDIYTYLIW